MNILSTLSAYLRNKIGRGKSATVANDSGENSMYSRKFKTALRHVLVSEGGNDDDPNDEGGRTGQGITQSEYSLWLEKHGHERRDVWEMPDSHRNKIYHDKYWDPVKGKQLPLPVAYAAFDSAVLHGVHFTKRAIQKAVGVKADGVIGPITIAALNAVDPSDFWNALRRLRWARMKTKKSFHAFKKGWDKRLNDVENNINGMINLPS